MATMRDKLRAATVGKAVEYPTDEVEIGEGLVFEVKALSYTEKQSVHKAATEVVFDPNMTKQEALEAGKFEVEFDQETYELGLLLHCCVDPEEGEPVFEQSDIDDFKRQPAHADHWLARLIDKATELNKAGNLKTTPSD